MVKGEREREDLMGKRMLYAPRELLLAEGLPVMQTLYNLCMSAVHMVLIFFWESEHKFTSSQICCSFMPIKQQMLMKPGTM